MTRRAACLALLLLTLRPAAAQDAPPRLLVDGQDVLERSRRWTLDGERRPPAAGDLVDLMATIVLPAGEHPLTLGDGGAWVTVGDRPVAVVVRPETRDRFLALSNDAVRGLWGLELRLWDEAIARQVVCIDPARTCVTVARDAVPRGGALPALPADLQHLVVEARTSDLSPLAPLVALRALRLEGGVEGAGAGALAAMRELRLLALREPLHDDAGLALPELRHALLPPGQGDVGWLARSPRLRALVLLGAATTDLSPLGGLERLAWIDARGSALERLPDGPLPALEELDVMSTPLLDDVVAEFAGRHPRARVRHRWDTELTTALARTTRVRVRTGGGCHRDRAEERTLFELSDPAAIAVLARHLELEREGEGACMCCGGPTIEAYAGEELAASLTVHHGEGLRWSAWPGDGPLSDRSQRWLADWLETKGQTAGWPPAPAVDHPGGVLDLAFSADGERLASVGADGSLKLWRVADGQATPLASQVAEVVSSAALRRAPHRNAALPPALGAVRFAPDGRTLVTRDDLGVVRLHPHTLDAPPRALVGASSRWGPMALSASGARLVVGQGHWARGARARVEVWELPAGTLLRTIEAGWPHAAITPDGTHVLVLDRRGARLVAVATGEVVRALDAEAGLLAFSPDGRLLVTGAVKVLDVTTGALVWQRRGHDLDPTALALVGDRLAVYDARAGRVVFLDLATGEQRAVVEVPEHERLRVAAISPDGRWLAQGLEGDVRLVDLGGR